MAEIELKSKKLPLKLHKFESKCLQRCLLFQSKLNLEKSINSSHGNVGIKHLFCLKNQNLKFFDEINDTIPDIDLIMSNYDKENLSCINVTKQNFPINMSNIKQIELFSEKALFLLEVELDSIKNEEINRLKYILQDYAKLNFELVTNVIKFFKKRLEVMR